MIDSTNFFFFKFERPITFIKKISNYDSVGHKVIMFKKEAWCISMRLLSLVRILSNQVNEH